VFTGLYCKLATGGIVKRGCPDKKPTPDKQEWVRLAVVRGPAREGRTIAMCAYRRKTGSDSLRLNLIPKKDILLQREEHPWLIIALMASC
jgi:hypothetical protein